MPSSIQDFSPDMVVVPIIILNYNAHSDCAKCISFLLRQEGVDLEIIVVDNNSAMEDLMALRSICSEHGCTLLENKENRGYNAGNNIGLRYAASKGYAYALVANPDMEFPNTHYIASLVCQMERKPSAVVVASDIVTPEGIHQNPLKRENDWRTSWNWLSSLFFPKHTNTYSLIDNPTCSHSCYKVSGCCLLLRMSFVQDIGFFDEGVFLYNEEAILSRQVERAKRTMYYTSEVQALHRHVESEKGNPILRLHHRLQANNYYIDKYSGFNWWRRWAAKTSIRINVNLLQLRYRLKTWYNIISQR